MIGPNHRDGCTGERWCYSGYGYNRVRLCVCGAEDHDPTFESLNETQYPRSLRGDLPLWSLEDLAAMVMSGASIESQMPALTAGRMIAEARANKDRRFEP